MVRFCAHPGGLKSPDAHPDAHPLPRRQTYGACRARVAVVSRSHRRCSSGENDRENAGVGMPDPS